MADKTATQAPAPAAPPPAPSNAASVPESPLDDDAQIVEDLRKEHFAKEGKEDPDAAPEEIEDEPAPEQSEEDEPEPEKKPAKAKKPPAKAPKYKSGDDAVSAIVKAVESGDPKKIAQALGKPDNFLEVNNHKWVAFREQSKAIRERERTVVTRETEFNKKLQEAKKEHEPIFEAAQAYKDGKHARFVELIEHITGDTYDEATRKVIKGEVALSPEMKALRKELADLRAERQREKAQAEQAAQQGHQQAQYQRAIKAVQTELAAHPIAKVRDFENLVLGKVRDSWDGADYTMSFEEAADEIVEARRAEAEALGLRRVAPRAAAPAPNGSSVPPRSRPADARQPDGEEWEKRDLTEEELVNSIVRDARTGRIKRV